MAHTLKNQKKLTARIRRIKGQVNALEALLETESDCARVLQQVAAIRGAANGLMLELLEGHLLEHLVLPKTESGRFEEFQKILPILKTYLK